MSDVPPQAVFLSYASQDVAAAKKICEALRAAGVEVWFDQSELVGGDAWDAKIRKQIAECALFVPVISTHTQARLEGYFRIEWKLAAQRTHAMADEKTFLLPVVIDGTRDTEAKVPAEFKAVQWSRLPGGEGSEVFCARVAKLVAGDQRTAEVGGPRTEDGGQKTEDGYQPLKKPARRNPPWLTALIVLVPMCAGLYFAWRVLPFAHPAANNVAATKTTPAPAAQTEARQLALKAQNLINALESTRDDHRFAEELVRQAEAKDPTDAEIFAVEAQIHSRFIIRGWEDTNARLEAGRVAVQKALRLDPQSFEARFADAALLSFTGREAKEKEAKLRGLRAERPDEHRVLRMLAETIERQEGRLEESLPFFDEAAALPGGDPLALYSKSMAYWFDGRTAEADAALQGALAQKPFLGAKLVGVWYALLLHGDVARARHIIDELPATALREDRAGYFAFVTEFWGRNWDAARERLRDVPRDWIGDSWYNGPKGLLTGDTYRAQGSMEAAKLEWQAALKLVEQRRAASSNNLALIGLRLELLARLGDGAAAEREAKLLQEAAGVNFSGDKPVPSWATVVCLELGRHADAIRQISLQLKQRNRAVIHTSWELKLSPLWDPLRNDPAFAAVIAQAEAAERDAARR